MKYHVLFDMKPIKLLSFLLLLCSCISVPKQYQIIAPGIWRGIFILQDTRQILVTRSIDKVVTRDVNPESTQTIIPFNFEVIYKNDTTFYIELINGKERIRMDSIRKGRDLKTGNDTMVISLLPYAAELRCVYENNKINGEYVVLDKVNYSIPFQASYGQKYRFEKLPATTDKNITGEWDAIFDKDSIGQFNAIGEFQQNGNILSGTFRTETGDFRYLSGEISGNQLKLSTFDGAHAFLFTGEINNDEIHGQYYSGKHFTCRWEAKKSDHNHLIDADSVAKLVRNIPLRFNLQNTEGDWVNLEQPEFKGKGKIIQITGTWCPNCRDETEFLTQYLSEHPATSVEFFSIAFERGSDRMKSLDRIWQYKKNMKIPYHVLLGGPVNKDSSSALFPQLDGIKAYPTILFVNAQNQIVRVHTGFDGPATSKYSDFKNYFEKSIEIISKPNE